MGFETLLGNDRLKQNLAESLAKKHISHFYLISGPEGSGKHTLARLLAAAILCGGSRKPCGTCGPCRKVMEDNHPDLITVVDPDHKTVPVKMVRQIRDDVFIRPNESDYKIYLFPQELGTEGQNALLKILEEPPEYGVFLLLTDNPDKILPTVRSRCTELKLLALPDNVLRTQLRRDFPDAQEDDLTAAIARSGGYLGQAKQLLESGEALPPQTEDFIRALADRNTLLLVQTLAPMEKWKRDALLPVLRSWVEIVQGALVSRSGSAAVASQSRGLAQARTAEELHKAVLCLKKAIDYTLSNVSPAAVCGWLAWELR